MKEAMRMHPAVGFPLERYVPPEGAEICGYLLPAGTNVSISAPVIHMNQDIFGNDAAEYRPERWLEASPERLREMDRCFLAVSADEDLLKNRLLIFRRIVRTWFSYLHWEKYINHGDGKVCATDSSVFRDTMGVRGP